MTDEKPVEPQKPVDPSQKIKEVQINMLDKLASGGMNQNDVLAFMSAMNQGGEKTSMQDTMNMLLMSRMMNPPQKQDSTTPLIMWMMIDGMRKSNGDSDINKKIEALQKAIEKKEEDSKFKEVLAEIKEMQKSKEVIGLKDILNIVTNKDQTIEAIRGIANEKDRELLLTQFQGSIGSLQEEIKKLGSGGDISKVSDTIKQIKEISGILNLSAAGQKSKEEIIKDMVSSIATSFAPAVNNYVQQMGQRQQTLDQEQMMRLEQIRAQRGAPTQPAQPQNPGSEPASEPHDEGMGIVGKDVVFPDLIDISSGPTGKRRRE